MFNTHIKHTIQRWIVSNGTLLEVLVVTIGAVAGAASTVVLAPQGHFLQRQEMIVTAWKEAPVTPLQLLDIPLRTTDGMHAALNDVSSVSSETLRAAAPVFELIEESASSSVAAESSIASSDVSSSMSSTQASSSAENSSADTISSSLASSDSSEAIAADTGFPAFGNAIQPVSRVPDWGYMKTPAEWNRTYKQMRENDFVRVPAYDLSVLIIPVKTLADDRDNPETIKALTAKLYYSTRFFGAYDLDASEFSAVHPGIDLKLPEGMPVGTVAGGRVHDVRRNEETLGLHVIIEHRTAGGETFYSIYGHLGAASVKAGDAVTSGQMIGTVGMSGNTSGAHLHLQIDRGDAGETYHTPYWPASLPSRSEADRHTVNPATFVVQY